MNFPLTRRNHQVKILRPEQRVQLVCSAVIATSSTIIMAFEANYGYSLNTQRVALRAPDAKLRGRERWHVHRSFFGSSGESVGSLTMSGLGREEAMELTAGGIEGALLLFGVALNERAAIFMDDTAQE